MDDSIIRAECRGKKGILKDLAAIPQWETVEIAGISFEKMTGFIFTVSLMTGPDTTITLLNVNEDELVIEGEHEWEKVIILLGAKKMRKTAWTLSSQS